MGIEETAAHYDHEDIVLLHENMLKTTADEVKEINKKIYGIPQRMESLEKSVTGFDKSVNVLSKNLSDFLQKIEDKYVTKEMAELCDKQLEAKILAMQKDYDEKIAALKLENEKLEKKFDKVIWGAVLVGVSILGYAGSTAINLVISALQKGAAG